LAGVDELAHILKKYFMIKKLRNHSSILLLLTILFAANNNAISQTKEKESYRYLVKETLNNYYLDDDKKSFNSYTERNNLIFELDYNIDLTMSEYRELNEPQILVERSKEIAYKIISEICNSVLISQIKVDCDYSSLNLNFKFKTKDYKYIEHKYNINIESLYSLSNNFNKNGFEKILNKI